MEDVRVYQRHYGEDPSITKLYKPDKVCVVESLYACVYCVLMYYVYMV